jgi:hypothetical protein
MATLRSTDLVDQDIPEQARTLIAATSVDSVISLEVLLLLYRQPEREWTDAEVAAELLISTSWRHARLADLARDGLLAEMGSPPHTYRYYPSSMELNAAVATVARTYAERPRSVVTFIHSKPGRGLWNLFEGRLPRM